MRIIFKERKNILKTSHIPQVDFIRLDSNKAMYFDINFFFISSFKKKLSIKRHDFNNFFLSISKVIHLLFFYGIIKNKILRKCI